MLLLVLREGMCVSSTNKPPLLDAWYLGFGIYFYSCFLIRNSKFVIRNSVVPLLVLREGSAHWFTNKTTALSSEMLEPGIYFYSYFVNRNS